MATSSFGPSQVQDNGSIEDRVSAALSRVLADRRETSGILNLVASLVTSLEVQLSTWVGVGGAKAITERAGQITSRTCSIFPHIRFDNGTAALESPPDVNDAVLAQMLEACLQCYVVNIFKVVESLTGNVLIGKLMETIRPLVGDPDSTPES